MRGRELGRQEERKNVAINLLRAGVPLETIAQATKLSIAQLEELQAQLRQAMRSHKAKLNLRAI